MTLEQQQQAFRECEYKPLSARLSANKLRKISSTLSPFAKGFIGLLTDIDNGLMAWSDIYGDPLIDDPILVSFYEDNLDDDSKLRSWAFRPSCCTK